MKKLLTLIVSRGLTGTTDLKTDQVRIELIEGIVV